MSFNKSIILGLLLVLFSSPTWAQLSEAASRMASHITILAGDDMEGRETGKPGEAAAADYVESNFRGLGLKPMGIEGEYQQPFPFLNRLMPGKDATLSYDGKALELGQDFFILPESGDGVLEGTPIDLGFGIHAPQLGYDDYAGKEVKGKLVMIHRGTPDGDDPHGKFGDYSMIGIKLETAAKMGVGGVVLVNPTNQEMENVVIIYTRKSARNRFPVVFLPSSVHKPGDSPKLVSGKVSLLEENLTGHNVIGYYDYGKPYTIVIGAHYDHLGYGDEGSLHRGESAIHNGADDNASGTAMMIELARLVKGNEGLHNYNYLFMAFSGEEKGLLGSNYFTKNPTIDLSKVCCMLNFDMVGRLDPEKNTLGINAVGTSPFWKEAIAKIQIDDMKVKTAESGVGPSDHTSFYLRDLPVLHFFSGTHSEYHKPGDDEHLINYDGIDKIYRYVGELLVALNVKGGKLDFTTTKNDEEGAAPRWKVSLGVVPDYLFDGEGMRIDGVTEGKPAAKAGLLAGDVVIKMGENEVKDMMGYMRALSKFEKGDKVKVVVLRKGKPKSKTVEF